MLEVWQWMDRSWVEGLTQLKPCNPHLVSTESCYRHWVLNTLCHACVLRCWATRQQVLKLAPVSTSQGGAADEEEGEEEEEEAAEGQGQQAPGTATGRLSNVLRRSTKEPQPPRIRMTKVGGAVGAARQGLLFSSPSTQTPHGAGAQAVTATEPHGGDSHAYPHPDYVCPNHAPTRQTSILALCLSGGAIV
jgi:hypothetical protein